MVEQMQILEREPHQDVFNTLDGDVMKSILLGIKEAVLNKLIAQPLKQELSKSLEKYIDASLTDITYNDKKELLLRLSEHFEIIKPLINACKKTQETFKNRSVRINLNTDMEDPTFFSLSLAIKSPSFDEKEIDQIESLGTSLNPPFHEHGVLFYLEPEFTE